MKNSLYLKIISFIVGLSGCAHVDVAQFADSTTTAIGLSHGFVETNPFFGDASWPVIAVVKLGVTQVVKLTPEPICTPGLMGLTVSGYGFALWNIGVMAGSGLYALPIIAGVNVLFWDRWLKDAEATCQHPWNRNIFPSKEAHFNRNHYSPESLPFRVLP